MSDKRKLYLTKDDFMNQDKKLQNIEQMIKELQLKKKRIEERRVEKVVKILTRCGIQDMPDEVLAGAIYDAVEAFKNDAASVRQWREDGARILRPGRGRRRFSSESVGA